MASWEERLDQLEQNFLAEVERLKEDILGQLNVNTDKYYTIDNEVTTSFTSSLAVPSACWTTPSLTKIEKGDEHAAATAVETPKGPIDGECSTSNNNVEPPSVTPPDPPVENVVVPTVEESPPPPSTPPTAELPAAVSSTVSPPQVGRSRRATPARQAEAHVVRVRVAYKFESQEEDELPLAKGLELIAFMREDESWWWGQRPDGKVGIFPSNFVTVLAGDPAALPIREDDDDEAGEQQEELQEEGDAVHPPLQQSSPSEHATAAGAPSVAAEAEVETPPASSQRRPPPPPSARLKPTTLLGPTAAASAADGTQGAASDSSNPAVSTTTSTSTTPKKPAVPQPSLKPTQRGEAAKKDWHEKRRSILLLQEQSRTTRLLAQWEKAGAGLSFAPPPAQ